jgi:CheY-like chemotaxis protein
LSKILIVEDNELNRDMLSRRLSRSGYDVVLAVHGEEGVAKAVSEGPDLILMDLSLPVLDGWEATRRIKSGDATASIPVIGLSAHAMEADEARARKVGCDDFDTKPIELPRLLGKIEALLRRGPPLG